MEINTRNNGLRGIAIAMAMLSFLGLSDAVFLTAEHYANASTACLIVEGCNRVTASAYAAIRGVPVALLGIFYYAAVLALTLWFLKRGGKDRFGIALRLTIVGFAVSLWFTYAQAFLIGAFCAYCLASAVISTALFALGMYGIKAARRVPETA